jgi:hypothetical protein
MEMPKITSGLRKKLPTERSAFFNLLSWCHLESTSHRFEDASLCVTSHCHAADSF